MKIKGINKLTEDINDNTDIIIEYLKLILERLDKIVAINELNSSAIVASN